MKVKDIFSKVLENSVTQMTLGKDSIKILNQSETISLGTVDANGEPHVVPVWFVVENGHIMIGSTTISQKTRDVKGNKYVAFCAKSISVSATAQILKNDSDVKFCTKALISKYDNSMVKDLADKINCMIKLEPYRVHIW